MKILPVIALSTLLLLVGAQAKEVVILPEIPAPAMYEGRLPSLDAHCNFVGINAGRIMYSVVMWGLPETIDAINNNVHAPESVREYFRNLAGTLAVQLKDWEFDEGDEDSVMELAGWAELFAAATMDECLTKHADNPAARGSAYQI